LGQASLNTQHWLDAGRPRHRPDPERTFAYGQNERSAQVVGPRESLESLVYHAPEFGRLVSVRDVLNIRLIEVATTHGDEVEVVRRNLFEQQRIGKLRLFMIGVETASLLCRNANAAFMLACAPSL
jgi:hypothetical protein